ncbi:hypothetical protein N7G274_009800 [Stereocaulon virgatum]|uniref:Uncharacterized protein n=1 Tax=Stereocaulon virgatum TaxID=373712 RepID=A0ABR3ZYA2_9LECA
MLRSAHSLFLPLHPLLTASTTNPYWVKASSAIDVSGCPSSNFPYLQLNSFSYHCILPTVDATALLKPEANKAPYERLARSTTQIQYKGLFARWLSTVQVVIRYLIHSPRGTTQHLFPLDTNPRLTYRTVYYNPDTIFV